MKKELTLAPKKRVWEVDFLRGLAIILVVWDHAMYDYARVFPLWASGGNEALRSVFLFADSYIYGDLRFFWRPAFLFLFFFTSGLCTALSKNNFFRGLRLWAVACAVSLVTFVIEALSADGVFALFGVLHCLAVCILTFALVALLVKGVTALYSKCRKKEYDKNFERWFSTALSFALAAAFTAIHFVFNVRLSDMTLHYATVASDSKIIGLFFTHAAWWTADYFPLFPYVAFFYFGVGFSRVLYEKKRSLLPLVDGYWNRPFCFAGRHSLVVYLGGQVVAVVIGVIANLIAYGKMF